jgi:C-terminal processing protease CtpA/Prc
MNIRNLLTVGGVAAFSLALIALPAAPAKSQTPNDSTAARLRQKIAELQAELDGRKAALAADADEARAVIATDMALEQENQAVRELDALPEIAQDAMTLVMDEEGSSWLGVELHEVTSESAKELKLSAERGVVVGRIVPDSPAAKAGLKEKDVVTELNGQRVEGAAQFRRMVHEIPAGRSVQLTIWRDGRTQTLSVTLGKSEEGHRGFKMVAPEQGNFMFRMPEIPAIPPMEWNGEMLFGGQPRLGIDAEDLNGQLGTFFGAPDGEGILVREVNSGSPAEKAGVKAGDVITSFNGERIRTLGDLREKLSAKREDKDKTVKLGVLRNKSEVSLTVELPAPAARTKRLISRRTNI